MLSPHGAKRVILTILVSIGLLISSLATPAVAQDVVEIDYFSFSAGTGHARSDGRRVRGA
jgi:hypothetical protein